jgi:4'-phosphopantetheinyl transferase
LTPSPPKIRPGETHVWRMRLPADEIDASHAWATLGAEERLAASRLTRPADRYARVQGRAALRRILGRLVGCGPADVPIGTTEHGKPVLAAPLDERGLSFSVSHSGAMVLIAIGAGLSVGVDVEEMQDSFAWEPVASLVLTRDERRAIELLPAAQRRSAFFGCWVRKEAYLKGLGIGLKRDPSEFSVPVGTAAGVVEDPVEADAGTMPWTVRSLHAASGFAAAVAHQGASDLVIH